MKCQACENDDHDNCGMQTWCSCDCEGFILSGMFVTEDADGERLNRKPDWTYSEGCGCRVTFFGTADYHTSRMLPGETCEDHTGRHQVAERDCLIERAKAELENYRRQR